jgi:hypothetical protein
MSLIASPAVSLFTISTAIIFASSSVKHFADKLETFWDMIKNYAARK